MFNLGPFEIAFFLGIVLLLFGPDKIPQLAKSVGKATREYQSALKNVTEGGDSLMKDVKGEENTGLKSTAPSSQTDVDQPDRETQIMQQAVLLGINTKGKTVDQIVDEILSRDDS